MVDFLPGGAAAASDMVAGLWKAGSVEEGREGKSTMGEGGLEGLGWRVKED
jgi:hypothetical protein